MAAYEPPFTKEFILRQIDRLKTGNIKPDIIFNSDKYRNEPYTLLMMVVHSPVFTVAEKLQLATDLIGLGCDVDQIYTTSAHSPHSPFTRIANLGGEYAGLHKLYLQYHQYNHPTDAELLSRAGTGNLKTALMFIKSGKLNINAVTLKKECLMHKFAKNKGIENFTKRLSTVLEFIIHKIASFDPNLKDENGLTAFDLSVRTANKECIEVFREYKIFKVTDATDPKVMVFMELTPFYDGNFWEKHPDLVSYAIEKNKKHLLPPELADVFLF